MEWISVKDSTPETKEPIVFARPKSNGKWGVGIAYWSVSKTWVPEMESVKFPTGFNYWMPLPEPPVEG